jgi:hypothetical protein
LRQAQEYDSRKSVEPFGLEIGLLPWRTAGLDGIPGIRRTPKAMYSPTDVAVQAVRTLQSTHPALRHLCVEGSRESLIISGTVTCYYYKQLAQEALRSLLGDLQLVNQVKVNAN